MNLLDRSIASIAPTWALRRAESRARLQGAMALRARLEREGGLDSSRSMRFRSMFGLARGRRYEGAANTNRTAGWVAGAHSANAEIGPALDRLRARSRDLVRNNGWAARAVRYLTTNTVGSVGMVPSPMGEADGARSRELVDAWSGFMGSTEIDPGGQLTFAAMQAMAVRSQMEGGEVLIRRRWRRSTDGFELPFQLQLLEADHIDTERFGMNGRNTIIQGVEFSPLGERVAYWLFPVHPGELYSTGGFMGESKRIPARDICHFFEPLRVGQVRGVPRGCPVLIKHRDQADYDDATLVRAKVAALTVAFIRKPFDEDMPAATADATAAGEADYPIEEMTPGMLEYLRPGEDVSFNSPLDHTSVEEFSRLTCRQIAAGWGVSYEALTGDLTSVTFSSAKIGRMMETAELDAYRRLWFVPQVCHKVWRWFQEAAQVEGIVAPGPLLRASWTPPRREMIQPAQEIRAMREQVNAGLLTWSEALRQLGYNPRHVAEEMKTDLEALAELGVEPDLLIKLAAEAEDAEDDDPAIETGTDASRSLARNGVRAIAEIAGNRS